MEEAERAARDAAERAGVEIAELTAHGDLVAAALLFGELWQERDGSSPVNPHVLSALALTGNYVSGGWAADGSLLGASVAWAAPRLPGDLHSHITGVRAQQQRSGIGLALKLHQRAWALRHGFTTISWTFDPLVRRNAVFNLARLGATVEGYIVSAYGAMHDSRNAGDESDRLLVSWELSGEHGAEVRDERMRRGARPLLVLAVGPGGEPQEKEPPCGARLMALEIPPDIERLRRDDPATARAWRKATRRLLGDHLAAGGRLVGLDEQGRYLLEAKEPS